MTASRRHRAAVGAATLTGLLTGLLGLWLTSRVEPEPAALDPAAPLPAAVARAPRGGAAPLERATDGVPLMPHEPVDTAVAGPRHPHPHTAEHERIYRENGLVGQLSGAMDRKDLVGLRLLLAQYREEFPEDRHRLQEGYSLIADCLEGSTETARVRAERYYREQRGSTLRRYVRRHCLERSS